jgi:hypothetical protein
MQQRRVLDQSRVDDIGRHARAVEAFGELLGEQNPGQHGGRCRAQVAVPARGGLKVIEIEFGVAVLGRDIDDARRARLGVLVGSFRGCLWCGGVSEHVQQQVGQQEVGHHVGREGELQPVRGHMVLFAKHPC